MWSLASSQPCLRKKATDELMLKLALKTHEVMQLEKVIEMLEGMR